jgi:hypothetical protein
VIREDDTRYREAGWDGNLEGISLCARGDRTGEEQACSPVVEDGGEDYHRSSSSLLVAKRWAEGEPENVTTVRKVGH